MPDMEKVIKWLDVCKTADRAVGLKEDYPCRECPYKDSPRCMRELVADALALLKEQKPHKNSFTVIDKHTGEYPNVVSIARRCKWAKNLIYCDIDQFVIGEDGTLMLTDDCGNVAYCPADRFEVIWDA